jgi:hypothetical protein
VNALLLAPLILALLDSQTKVTLALIQSQTADQQKILWDRHIQLTEPLYRILLKIETLIVPAVPQLDPATAHLSFVPAGGSAK